MRPPHDDGLSLSMEREIIELTELAQTRRAPFGEFLVTARVLDRFQLFRALQMQDRMPGARLGECAVALGYVPKPQVEQMHDAFTQVVAEAELETMMTHPFERSSALDFDIDVEGD